MDFILFIYIVWTFLVVVQMLESVYASSFELISSLSLSLSPPFLVLAAIGVVFCMSPHTHHTTSSATECGSLELS